MKKILSLIISVCLICGASALTACTIGSGNNSSSGSTASSSSSSSSSKTSSSMQSSSSSSSNNYDSGYNDPPD